ncbi:DUF1441 family protein [Citrobacter koseri]|uniref:DUF1441 family protein n=1 Tax=Citrobacter koseri TaxID=545 RepID=UPI00215A0436|nr:DUF1441 family protein [Citrobacter koseri]QYG86914.1 DUF1441 family protein [Citrobacter koseri]
MDNELKNLRLNINQLAALTDLHRQTVASRLNNVEPAPGSNSRLKLYSVLDILRELLGRTTTPELVDVDKMLPPDRKAWFQSERERLKFQQETGELIPASAVIGAHSHTVGIGAHSHNVTLGAHSHAITVSAAGNAENTVKNTAFNYIVRLA